MCPAAGGAEDIMRWATLGPPYGVLPYLFVGRDAHIAPPYNAFLSTFAPHQRQRRKKKVDSSYATKMSTSRERVVNDYSLAQGIARRKSRNLGFWLFFWTLLEQWPKCPASEDAEYFSLESETLTYLQTKNTPDLPVRRIFVVRCYSPS